MSQNKIRLAAASLLIITATTSARAISVTSNRTVNLLQDASPVASPWFTLPVSGSPAFAAATDSNGAPLNQAVSIKPQTPTQAGQVNSLISHGTFTLTGNATSTALTGPWTDGNGIPAGVILKFQTDTTYSAQAGAFLTLSGTQANGLGITPTQGGSGQIHVGDTLTVSDFTVSNLVFTGTPTEAFAFSSPTVGNFAPYVIRSAGASSADGLDEATETAGLYSVPPDPSGKPTIGFGGAGSTTPGDGTPGDGTAAAHLAIENGFGAQTGTNGNGNTFANLGPTGGFTFQVGAGFMAIKGIGYQYKVTYNVVAAPTGDYNHNGVVDAADYVLWRNGDIRADGNSDTVVDQLDYDIWRGNFGATAGAGAGSALGSAAVPEPTTVGLLAMGLLTVCSRRNSASRA